MAIFNLEWRMALAKAESAYGDAVVRDVHRAVTTLKNHPDRLFTCIAALAVDVPAALMLDRLKRLESRC
jgi:hypothetical protein